MKRGEIYYEKNHTMIIPGVQNSGRPVVIVSKGVYGQTVVVVPLTTNPDRSEFESNVHICSTGRESYALCGNIRTVNVGTLGDKLGECSGDEMDRIDSALAYVLGLKCTGGNPAEQSDMAQNAVIPESVMLKLRTAAMLIGEALGGK